MAFVMPSLIVTCRCHTCCSKRCDCGSTFQMGATTAPLSMQWAQQSAQCDLLGHEQGYGCFPAVLTAHASHAASKALHQA
jgi:hypothetical protein